MIKRVDNNLILNNKFIFLYGNTNDVFCDNNLLIFNLEFLLKRILSDKYKKILFFDFYDKKESNKQNNNTEILGPLGNLNLIKNKKIIYKKSYINEFLAIDKYISDNNSIAIIFNHLKLFSSDYIGENSFNFLKNKLFEFLNIKKDIKFIFIFHSDEINNISKSIENNKLDILNKYIKNNNLLKIEYPDKNEISNLINSIRLKNKLSIDWLIYKNISNIIYNENFQLKDLYLKLNKVKSIDKNTIKKWSEEKFLKNINNNLVNNLDSEFSFNLFIDYFDKLEEQDIVKEKIINLLDIWYKTSDSQISLLLVGKPFVGKSLTIEIIYKIMKKNMSYKLVNINNENYQDIIIEKKTIIVFEKVEHINKEVWRNFSSLFRENNSEIIILLTSNIIMEELATNFLDFNIQNKIRNYFTKINYEIFSNIDYFIPYKETSNKIKYQIIKEEIEKIIKDYGLNLVSIDDKVINGYLKKGINSNNIKDIKNNIRYNISNLIIKFKKENPRLKDISI